MAQLVIKGHETRGNEVIEILEMLGGKNYDIHNGALEWTYSIDMSRHACYYYIDVDGNIECSHNVGIPLPGMHFTLEEFLERFPYKVGDKVKNARINDFIGRIKNIRWDDNEKQIIYVVEWDDVTKSTLSYFAKGLQPYKEETMEEKR